MSTSGYDDNSDYSEKERVYDDDDDDDDYDSYDSEQSNESDDEAESESDLSTAGSDHLTKATEETTSESVVEKRHKKATKEVRIIEKIVNVTKDGEDQFDPCYEDYMSPSPSPKPGKSKAKDVSEDENRDDDSNSSKIGDVEERITQSVLKKLNENRKRQKKDQKKESPKKSTGTSTSFKGSEAKKGKKSGASSTSSTREITAAQNKFKKTLEGLHKSIEALNKKVFDAKAFFDH